MIITIARSPSRGFPVLRVTIAPEALPKTPEPLYKYVSLKLYLSGIEAGTSA